jgi:hypothetical protein
MFLVFIAKQGFALYQKLFPKKPAQPAIDDAIAEARRLQAALHLSRQVSSRDVRVQAHSHASVHHVGDLNFHVRGQLPAGNHHFGLAAVAHAGPGGRARASVTHVGNLSIRIDGAAAAPGNHHVGAVAAAHVQGRPIIISGNLLRPGSARVTYSGVNGNPGVTLTANVSHTKHKGPSRRHH